MAIGNAVQQGSWVKIYDEKGRQTGSVTGELRGYTGHQVNVQRGSWIHSYDERGRQIGSVAAPQSRSAPPSSPAKASRAAPASRSSSRETHQSSSTGDGQSGGGMLGCFFLAALLIYGGYQYLRSPQKGAGENAASVGNQADPIENAADQVAVIKTRAEPRPPSNGDQRSLVHYPIPLIPANRNPDLSVPTWDTETIGLDLSHPKIVKEIAAALREGQAKRWGLKGREGYAVPSALQTGVSNECRNLYLTIFVGKDQLQSASSMYCRDINTGEWLIRSAQR